MAESEEALQLKRRARRRLIGAIALVSFVVIILPLMLDKEPGPAGPPLNVQIPSQESGGFYSGSVPKQGAAPTAANKAEESKPHAPAASGASSVAPKVEAPAQSPRAASKSDEARARAALNDETWVVTLDAFSDKNNVKALRSKLSSAGVKSFTESVKTSKGELTRVRAGPFATKEAADKARAKLAAMGLKPGAVTRQ